MKLFFWFVKENEFLCSIFGIVCKVLFRIFKISNKCEFVILLEKVFNLKFMVSLYVLVSGKKSSFFLFLL